MYSSFIINNECIHLKEVLKNLWKEEHDLKKQTYITVVFTCVESCVKTCDS